MRIRVYVEDRMRVHIVALRRITVSSPASGRYGVSASRSFLQRRADFHLEPADDLPVPVCTPEGVMATVPHRHGTDGAFAARLRREA